MKQPNIMTYIINPPKEALDEAIEQIADYAEVHSILATLYRTGEISADNRHWLNGKVGDQLRKQFLRDYPNGDIDESKGGGVMSSNLENSLLTALHKFARSNHCNPEEAVIYISVKYYYELRESDSCRNLVYDPVSGSYKLVGATLLVFKDENVDFYFAMANKEKEIRRLRLENQQLRSAIDDVHNLMDNSDGVSGINSSDVMPWRALLRGGNCEEWLGNFSDVSEWFLE